MMEFSVRILPLVMALAAAGGFFSLHSQAVADTQHLVIDSGDSALSHEAAREYREHWDDNRLLRKKINTRNIKQFNKADRATDLRDACEESLNLNAYWESNTLRCLDRRTGRPLQP